MERAVEITGYVNSGLFIALAVVALYQWRRQRGEATGWFAATFAALAAIVIAGLVQPDDVKGAVFSWVVKVEIAVLVLFPYFLYRFMASFKRPERWVDTLAAALTAGVIVWSFALPDFPSEGELRPPVFSYWLIALAIQWSFLSLLVTVRLWSAGRDQPSVARIRMRLLSLGSFGLAAAIVLTVAGGSDPETSAVELVVSGITFLSVLAFFFGFAPPSWMRVIWRRPESDALQRAVSGLMGARDPADVGSRLLPHVVRIIGARGAALLDSGGKVIATHGLSAEMLQELSDASGDAFTAATQTSRLLVLPYEFGSLVVWASPYTPFFGREEVGLISSLGALTDVAMERVELSRSVELAQRELEKANAAMADAFSRERLARVGVERAHQELESFVYSVSHDLNSPLISVQRYIDLLESDYGTTLPDEAKFYLERIRASSSYMQSLIGDLLELSRVGRVQTEPDDVDLEAIVDDVASEIRSSHPQLQVEIDDDLPSIRMNPLRARQLVANLMHNSVKYARRSDVCIEVRAEDDRNGLVTVSVADNGPGIDSKDRERVFGVFERIDTNQEGTGIGLAFCKRIVETSGGRIWIADSDVGTDVRMAIPRADGSAGAN